MAARTYIANRQRLIHYLIFLLLVATSFLCLVLFGVVKALELTDRSITVSTALPSTSTTHTFQFTYGSTGIVGSLVFEYCDNSALLDQPCNPPPGLDLTTAILTSQNGNAGFGVDNINTTPNKLVLTRIPIASLIVPSDYTITGFSNPSTPAHTEFIRITTYSTADASGPYTDNGSVAYATVNPFIVGAFVPPYLNFCVGVSVALNCSTASGNSIDLGNLSSAQASKAQSQFSTGTNDPSGYIVYGLGTTMTSGNNVIPALASPAPSFAGTSQFGINLRANSSPSIGEEPSGTGTGVPYSNYGAPNFFMFQDGDSLASSSLPSEYNRMTVSYIVNVSNSQPPGTYNKTLNYLATVQF